MALTAVPDPGGAGGGTGGVTVVLTVGAFGTVPDVDDDAGPGGGPGGLGPAPVAGTKSSSILRSGISPDILSSQSL